MPRSLLCSPLPGLKTSLNAIRGFDASRNKISLIVDALRPLITRHQRSTSIVFYPLREIAAHFSVSLRTAHLARSRLETEGLLIGIRGSHTEIPGSGQGGYRGSIQGVVGMPLWLFGARYSHVHKNLPYALGELLWKQNLVLETIPYSEVEDLKPDFGDHLLRHKIDFAIWLYPFKHNRNTILRLKDAGVRSIIIGHGGESPCLPPHIITDPKPAYLKVLSLWKTVHGIQKIVIPEGLEYNRGRGQCFARLAQAKGFQCRFVACTPGLTGSLLDSVKTTAERLGIALLDEHASAEFTHGNPSAFSILAKKHRILFGNNSINLPFIDDNELTVERIGHNADLLARLIDQTLARLRAGEVTFTPRRLLFHHDTWRLRRYV